MLDGMMKREHEEILFAAQEGLSHQTRAIGKSVLFGLFWMGGSAVFC